MGIVTGNIYAGLSGGGGGLTGAQNGTSVVSNFVELGGNPLLHDTSLHFDTFIFSMFADDGAGTGIDSNFQSAGYHFESFSPLFDNVFNLNPGQFSIQLIDLTGGGTIFFNSHPGVVDGMVLEDSITFLGFQYFADYSAIGHLNPKWLPSMGWIDGNFTHQPSRAIVNAVNSSRNLVNFATAPGNEMYRITVTTEILTGTGALATTVDYTDLSGNPQTGIPVDNQVGVGVSNNTKVLNILCQASTHISIDTVLTGVAQGSIGFSIELLA